MAATAACVTSMDTESHRRMDSSLILLGDVGGTNIRLSLVPAAGLQAAAARPTSCFSVRYATASFTHAADALEKFAHESRSAHEGQIIFAALSVCGPVTEGVAVCLAQCMGEKGWILEEAALAAAVGLPRDRLKLVNGESGEPPPPSFPSPHPHLALALTRLCGRWPRVAARK
jgi:glucokinase